MPSAKKKKTYKRLLFFAAGFVLVLLLALIAAVNIFLEPTLKKKLHTLIIEGSDSLYTYKLGNLKANFFGGNVEVENLEINIDSSRYQRLHQRNALPALTMQLKLKKGEIKGIGIIALLFGKKITIKEILSKEADIELSRHIHPQKKEAKDKHLPLWKAMQPAIKSISIDLVKFDGVKMLYKNADTAESVKLQFDRFDAQLKDIRIDSTAFVDTSRIGFIKDIQMQIHDLKFRTSDSSYKMKAKRIAYSSGKKEIEIDSFKLQPTKDKEDFYKSTGLQKSLYYIEFEKVRFVNTNLDHFIQNNIIDADSVILQKPEISIYLDKSQTSVFSNKMRTYPHQQLLKAGSTIKIRNIIAKQAQISYTEKNGERLEEGKLVLSDLNILINNITNDEGLIKQNNICAAQAQGNIFGSSPITASFKFYLDSGRGRFDMDGSVKNITAAQINPLSMPLGNVQLPSLTLHQLSFQIKADDFGADANVQMRYNNLSLLLRKTDEKTGLTTTKKFLTKLINKYAIYSDNPSANGLERKADNVKISRLTTQPFFGVIWKVIFAGMQQIILKSGAI